MTRSEVTLLTDSGTFSAGDCEVEGEDLWLREAVLESATGFHLEPEGLCRGYACFPLPYGREGEVVRPGEVNVAAFWRHRGGIVLAAADRDVWLLAEPASERAQQLLSLAAPDFTLPDPAGKLHSLSDFRGRKVFLATWASW